MEKIPSVTTWTQLGNKVTLSVHVVGERIYIKLRGATTWLQGDFIVEPSFCPRGRKPEDYFKSKELYYNLNKNVYEFYDDVDKMMKDLLL